MSDPDQFRKEDLTKQALARSLAEDTGITAKQAEELVYLLGGLDYASLLREARLLKRKQNDPPETSQDRPAPGPREDSDRDTREAVAKHPDKTNDWDRDAVHGDGDTIGIEPEPDEPSS